MQVEIQPKSQQVKCECSCGNKFDIRSTYEKEALHVDICSKCHPFYTGKQKIVTAGRVESIAKKYAAFDLLADESEDKKN
jgi:large subunit ribosomal protein L31